jgi:hypothetical protein
VGSGSAYLRVPRRVRPHFPSSCAPSGLLGGPRHGLTVLNLGRHQLRREADALSLPLLQCSAIQGAPPPLCTLHAGVVDGGC